jgi:hypothetical protein
MTAIIRQTTATPNKPPPRVLTPVKTLSWETPNVSRSFSITGIKGSPTTKSKSAIVDMRKKEF